MTPCPSCARHLRDIDATCPFCGSARPSVKARAFPRVFGSVGGAVTTLVLAACYDSPSGNYWDDTALDSTVTDVDSDGYDASVDCNDDDAAIHPDATEVCDDTVDNDCNGDIDAADEACATTR